METVKTLDRHLYAGAEIQEVYNEITKTSTKDFLAFDKVRFLLWTYVYLCDTDNIP